MKSADRRHAKWNDHSSFLLKEWYGSDVVSHALMKAAQAACHRTPRPVPIGKPSSCSLTMTATGERLAGVAKSTLFWLLPIGNNFRLVETLRVGAPVESEKAHEAAGQTAVESACIKEWPAHKSLCNKFVIAVANDVGVTLTGYADDIVDAIQRLPWVPLVKGGGAATSAKAAEGYLVIGGMKKDDLQMDNGHVVIVVPGSGQYPTAYWGQKGAVGRERTTINYAFNFRNDKHHRKVSPKDIVYGYYPVKAIRASQS